MSAAHEDLLTVIGGIGGVLVFASAVGWLLARIYSPEGQNAAIENLTLVNVATALNGFGNNLNNAITGNGTHTGSTGGRVGVKRETAPPPLAIVLRNNVLCGNRLGEIAGPVLDGALILIDEALTPDSSRYWPADRYRAGGPQPSFDKQFLRDFLEASGWNKQPPPPPLPKHVVDGTAERYAEALRRLS